MMLSTKDYCKIAAAKVELDKIWVPARDEYDKAVAAAKTEYGVKIRDAARKAAL